VLRNKHGITDAGLLQITESLESAKRLEELDLKPIRVKSAAALSDIHGYLFQDVYDWAGKVRTVNISKQGKPFLPVSSLRNGFAYVNELIKKYRGVGDNKTEISRCLAEILDAVNFLHPFREGNGRTQREFIRVLASEKGYTLRLNPPDNIEVYERYMEGTITGDVDILAELIKSILQRR
jgi:cell filamentation protein